MTDPSKGRGAQEETVPRVELVSYRRVKGHDGRGFEATLSVGGKKAAEVFDDGWGGPLQFTWLDEDLVEPFDTWVASLPPIEFKGQKFPRDRDTGVGLLVDRVETERTLRRDCTKKTLVVTPGSEPGSYLQYPYRISDDLRRHVLQQHPGAVFLNDHLEDGLWRQYMGVE